MSLFGSEKVSEHLWRITMPCGVCAYLVKGSKQAALLDTGFGIGDLKGYVESLIEVPYIVLLSHGHLDHAGGAGQFKEVFLNEKDWALEKWHCSLEKRLYDVHNGPGGIPEGVTDNDLLPSRTAPYRPLDEGDNFDLGGVTVKPIAVPGHTTGMLVFLLPEERAAILGDACGEGTLLKKEALPEYKEALCHLETFALDFDIVLRNHGSFWSPKQIVADNLALAGEIIAGEDAAYPTEIMGIRGCLGRPPEHPGKCGNIFYAAAAQAAW